MVQIIETTTDTGVNIILYELKKLIHKILRNSTYGPELWIRESLAFIDENFTRNLYLLLLEEVITPKNVTAQIMVILTTMQFFSKLGLLHISKVLSYYNNR